jgi:hypothetical protein
LIGRAPLIQYIETTHKIVDVDSPDGEPFDLLTNWKDGLTI